MTSLLKRLFKKSTRITSTTSKSTAIQHPTLTLPCSQSYTGLYQDTGVEYSNLTICILFTDGYVMRETYSLNQKYLFHHLVLVLLRVLHYVKKNPSSLYTFVMTHYKICQSEKRIKQYAVFKHRCCDANTGASVVIRKAIDYIHYKWL